MPTVNPAPDVVEAARGLRAALSGLAVALQTGKLEGILESEPALSRALSSLARVSSRPSAAELDAARAAELRAELGESSALVARCAAFGRTIDDVVRTRCGVSSYSPSGTAIASPVRGTLEQQV